MHRLITGGIVLLAIVSCFCLNKIEAKTNEIQELNQTVTELEQKNVELETKIAEYETKEEILNIQISQNKYYSQGNADNLVVKEELESGDISDYEYIQFVDGSSTDLTDDQIHYAVAKMKENGLNPHLLFCIFYNESRGVSKATNAKTDCRGYGQILESTGEYIYEDYLQEGSYNHDLAYDPYENIDLSVGLLTCLMEQNNGNLYRTMNSYSGNHDGSYYYRIAGLLPDGLSMQDIQNEYKEYHQLT